MHLPFRRADAPKAVRHKSRGQSMVELALIAPLLLLILLFAIDFGRVYLGWINLQNMARVAANFAANNADAWDSPGNATVQQEYVDLVANDALAINCTPDSIEDPLFPGGFGIGARVDVTVSCSFDIITPLIEVVLNDRIQVTASTTFPIKAGVVGGGGGGGPIIPEPVAAFVASPRSGFAPLTVTFTDTSTNNPTTWDWSFSGLPSGVTPTDPSAESTSMTFADPGTYTFEVTLLVTNDGGSDDVVETIEIEVLTPPATGPIPEFSADRLVGPKPLTVVFTDLSTNGPTSWEWDFDGNGSVDSTEASPTHIYPVAGTYDVTLTVSDGTTANSQTKAGYITVTEEPCTVPNFAGQKKNDAEGIWTSARFLAASITYRPGNGNYEIGFQSIQGGLENPPGGCNATIEVGP